MKTREFSISTDHEGMYNITARLREVIRESGVQSGIAVVYCPHTTAGITINENFQAVNDEGEAIEGLYVTGVDSGSYYAHTYPNMSTGNCCGRSVTFARMIGKALAAK